MLTQRLIESFLTLGETLNYTEAARRLYTSHQALSQQILRLEDILGHTLFLRTTRSVRLTPVGELFYAYFREQAANFDAVRQEAARIRRSQENDLRLGLLSGMNPPVFFQAAVRAFQEKHPGSAVHPEWYTVDDLTRYFESGLLDLVISLDDSGLGDNARLSRIALTKSRLVLAVARSHPCYGAERLPDFSGQTFYYQKTDAQETTYEDYVNTQRLLQLLDIRAARLEMAPNLQSRQTAVLLGLGCCLCIDQDTLCFNPDVRSIPVGMEATGISCYWERETKKEIVHAFVDCMRALVAPGGAQ